MGGCAAVGMPVLPHPIVGPGVPDGPFPPHPFVGTGVPDGPSPPTAESSSK